MMRSPGVLCPMMRSAIWSAVCFSMTRPQTGQWGVPMRA